MSNDLVQVNNQVATTTAANVSTGLDDVRIKPTNITLLQGTTRDLRGGKPGQFLDDLTGELYDELTLVPLRTWMSRVYFPPGGEIGMDPLCRSNDGKYPSPFAVAPQAANCAVCPQSQWVGKTRPPCNQVRRFLVVVKESLLPRFIQFKGKGLAPASKLLEQIKQDIAKTRALTGKPYDLYSYYFTVKADRETNSRGVFYVPIFENIRKVTDPLEFGPVYQEYVVRAASELEMEETEAATNVAVDNAIDAQVVDSDPPFSI